MRIWVFLFFILNSIFLMISIGGLSKEAFDSLGLTIVHSSLMSFALILLSFWVWTDENKIEDLQERIERIDGKIHEIKKRSQRSE
jgi:hypothetical protein